MKHLDKIREKNPIHWVEYLMMVGAGELILWIINHGHF